MSDELLRYGNTETRGIQGNTRVTATLLMGNKNLRLRVVRRQRILARKGMRTGSRCLKGKSQDYSVLTTHLVQRKGWYYSRCDEHGALQWKDIPVHRLELRDWLL